MKRYSPEFNETVLRMFEAVRVAARYFRQRSQANRLIAATN